MALRGYVLLLFPSSVLHWYVRTKQIDSLSYTVNIVSANYCFTCTTKFTGTYEKHNVRTPPPLLVKLMGGVLSTIVILLRVDEQWCCSYCSLLFEYYGRAESGAITLVTVVTAHHLALFEKLDVPGTQLTSWCCCMYTPLPCPFSTTTVWPDSRYENVGVLTEAFFSLCFPDVLICFYRSCNTWNR